MDWRSKRVLVTGAGGFIGSHLTERLVDLGATVRAFVHYNALGRQGWLDESPRLADIEVVAGDIVDRDCVRHAVKKVDIVFHLGALAGIPYSYHAPLSYIRTNIEGTFNVLQTARELDIERVVHTSTSEVYGTAQYVPIDENHPVQAQSPYSACKIGADKMAEAFHLSYGVPVVTVRPFNTYGERQGDRAVIPNTIKQVLDINLGEVRLGNVHTTRDFTYVQDTVEAFVKAAESKGAIGETINVGSGEEISIGDLARKIMALVDRDLPIVLDEQRVRPSGSEVERLLCDNSKAREYLGWQPEHTLEQGLAKTIEWLGGNIDRYRSTEYST